MVYHERGSQSSRTKNRARSPLRMASPRRRWDGVSWWFSLILLLPLLLIAANHLFGIMPDDGSSNGLTFRVSNSVGGSVIPGAAVTLGNVIQHTDAKGEVRFDTPDRNIVVQVAAKGFYPVYGEVGQSFGSLQRVSLRPVPVEAAETQTTSEAAVQGEPTTPVTQIPDTAPVATETPAETVAVDKATNEADPGIVASGVVLGVDGEPIYSALVGAGKKTTRTKHDGSFALKGADVDGGLFVTASGYARQELPAGFDLSIQMERQNIKAVYLNGNVAGDDAVVDDMIALIQRTEINAVVIDIKEGYVFYDTRVQFFVDADAVKVNYDIAALVKKFKDAGVYTIARQVVFNDPIVAEAHHELAVQDDVTGGAWRGADGGAWVNPFERDLWQPNIDLAVEAAGFGFDEIQFDYIRFPSDGDLSTADFGPDYSEEGRVGAIVDFLKASRKALAPTGAMLAADVFGIVAVYPDDQGIGQRVADIAKVVDYVCPMVYPSHFDASSIDVGGEPNALPYETVSLSVALALQKMPGMELKLRPWLQDFSYGEPKYGPEEVRAQITATEEQAGSGWLLWNAASDVTEDALKAQ